MASTKSKVVIASTAVLLLTIGGTTVLLRNRSSSVRHVLVSVASQHESSPEQITITASDMKKLPHDVTITAFDMKSAVTNGDTIEIPGRDGFISIKKPSAALPEVHVNTILFQGNSIFTEADLAKVIVSKVGEPVDQGKIDQDLIAIQKVYREAGYGNISVRAAQETDKSAGQSSVKFVVEEPLSK